VAESGVIAAEMEEVVDLKRWAWPADLNSSICRCPSARRLVRILSSVVQSLVLAMLNAGHDISLRRAVAGELVGDHDAWRPHLLLQQLAEQPFGRALVTPALDQNVEHNAGGPRLATTRHPGDLEHDLIEMPFVRPGEERDDGSGWRTAGRICAPTAARFHG
jgi:hypothetical protein